MKPRRSRFEIYMDILKAVAEGNSKPSHIMYRTNLTWSRVKEHLNFLVDQGMLKRDLNKRSEIYDITEKGSKILLYFKKINEALQLESLVMKKF